MNYSVGFRAPNTRELISGFADYVLQRELGGNYYSDPDVPPRAHPADVLPQEMDKLREMMLELINQPEHFKQWFGEFISQSRHELDIAPPEPPYQPDEIYDALKQGDVLVRLGGLRVLRIGDDVYANGEKIDSPHRPALDALASNIALTAENFGDALEDPSFLAMLAALVNSGLLVLRRVSLDLSRMRHHMPHPFSLTSVAPSTRQYGRSPAPLFPYLPASQTHAYHDSCNRQ